MEELEIKIVIILIDSFSLVCHNIDVEHLCKH